VLSNEENFEERSPMTDDHTTCVGLTNSYEDAASNWTPSSREVPPGGIRVQNEICSLKRRTIADHDKRMTVDFKSSQDFSLMD
jgi:hypothetical protein